MDQGMKFKFFFGNLKNPGTILLIISSLRTQGLRLPRGKENSELANWGTIECGRFSLGKAWCQRKCPSTPAVALNRDDHDILTGKKRSGGLYLPHFPLVHLSKHNFILTDHMTVIRSSVWTWQSQCAVIMTYVLLWPAVEFPCEPVSAPSDLGLS